MSIGQVVGYSVGQLGPALQMMEASMQVGEHAEITLCTLDLPSVETIEAVYNGMVDIGCHLSYPKAGMVDGVPTTTFILKKGSPAWPLIIPLIIPILTIGLVTFGIFKIESITRALVPILLITIGGIVLIGAVLSKPATKYIERGGKIPYLPANKPKLTSKCPHCGNKLDPIEPGVIRCHKCGYPVDISVEKKALAVR